MSIEYSSGIAEGWLFTQEEVDNFNKKTNHKYEDNFILIDSWFGNGEAIFGQWIVKNNNEGYAVPLSHNYTEGRLNISEWLEKFAEAGITTLKAPQLYLVNQVH